MSTSRANSSAAGTFDIHLHAGPDLVPRRCDDLELAQAAVEHGMSGFMIKAHHGMTVERAYLVAKAEPRLKVAGGITLNDWCGGFNPTAVEFALQMGARCVWMPTQSAANHIRHHGSKQGPESDHPGLTVLDETGKLLPAVRDILDLVAEADVMLSTGHLSVQEAVALFEAAQEAGVKRFVVTHAEFFMVDMPTDLQMEMARKGAFIEHCLLVIQPIGGSRSFDSIAANIRSTGADSHIISTDYGQADNPPPPEGMADFVDRLSASGFSDGEIERMAKENPLNLTF